MKYFLPGASQEKNEELVAEMKAAERKAVQSVSYMHDGARYVVEVSQSRKVYKRETGPRGGYKKNAEISRMSSTTGSIVNVILDLGHLIEVYSMPGDGWAFPSLIGTSEIEFGSIVYFEL